MLQGQSQKNQLRDLANKYPMTGFMYTEYPHKSFWSEKKAEASFKESLKNVLVQKPKVPLLLYVHIPYCEQLCWFCTCHMSITQDYGKVTRYLDWLYREIDLYREFFQSLGAQPHFTEIHLGGGSPTFLKEPEFDQLVSRLGSIADLGSLSEFSLEVDPRRVDQDQMKYYHRKGINRISFGVQDFDLEVQKAVNRVQPAELIENLLTPEMRSLFANGINFDIICGLPNQTQDSLRATCERIIQMGPDRVCLNYLHYAPKFAKHQSLMHDGRDGRPEQLPDFYFRKVLFLEALETLTKGGFVRTGYDHFAKPTDSVAQAMSEGKMRWNALGVTSGRYQDVLGIGVHSYSTMGAAYGQNLYETADYEAALQAGRLPIFRGHVLNEDDQIRRDVIQTLRSYFSLDFKSVEKKYGIDFASYFSQELGRLDDFIRDGIVQLTPTSIVITDLGHQFANLVCRHFDLYYHGNHVSEDLGERFNEKKTVADPQAKIQTSLKGPS